jgi:hypothetical protein
MGKTYNRKISYRQIRDHYYIACIYNLANSQVVGSFIEARAYKKLPFRRAQQCNSDVDSA